MAAAGSGSEAAAAAAAAGSAAPQHQCHAGSHRRRPAPAWQGRRSRRRFQVRVLHLVSVPQLAFPSPYLRFCSLLSARCLPGKSPAPTVVLVATEGPSRRGLPEVSQTVTSRRCRRPPGAALNRDRTDHHPGFPPLRLVALSAPRSPGARPCCTTRAGPPSGGPVRNEPSFFLVPSSCQ